MPSHQQSISRIRAQASNKILTVWTLSAFPSLSKICLPISSPWSSELCKRFYSRRWSIVKQIRPFTRCYPCCMRALEWAEWKIAIISPQTAPCLMGPAVHNALAAQSKWLSRTCYHMFSREKPPWAQSRPNDTLKTERLSNLDERVQYLNIVPNANNGGDQLHFLLLPQSL